MYMPKTKSYTDVYLILKRHQPPEHISETVPLVHHMRTLSYSTVALSNTKQPCNMMIKCILSQQGSEPILP